MGLFKKILGQNGPEKILATNLQSNPNKKEETKKKRYTAPSIIRYAEHAQIDKLKNELQNGADINATDRYGRSVLYCAVSSGDLPTIKLLFEKGVSLKAGNRSAFSPITNLNSLFGKSPEKCIEIAKILFENEAKPIPSDVVNAAGSNFVDMLKLFIEKDIDIQKKDKDISPLVSAVINGSFDTVKLLVDSDANVNEIYLDSSVLSFAINSSFPRPDSNPRIIEVLKNAGAK